MIILFENYLKTNTQNKTIFDGDFVAQYIIEISDDVGNDSPDYFISEYIIPSYFILKKLKISDLSKNDEDFNEYLIQNDDRYDYIDGSDEYPHYDNLFNPVVVFNNVVLDGYNRMTILHRLNINEVDAYVNINNKDIIIQ